MTLRSGSNANLEQVVEETKPSTYLRIQSALDKNWSEDGEAEQRMSLAEIKNDVAIYKLHAESIESIQADLIQVLEKLVRLKEEIKDGAMDAWHETAVSVLDENTVQNMVFMPQLGKQIGRISLLLSMEDNVFHPEHLIDLFTALDTAMVCNTEEGRNRQFLSESAVEKLVSLVSDLELTPAQMIKACEIIDRNLHGVSADALIELESRLAKKEASGPTAQVLENLRARLTQLCLFNYAMLDESDQRRALDIFCSDVETLKGMGSVPDIQDGLLHKLESLAKAKKDIKQEVMQDWYKAVLSVFAGDTAQHMVPQHSIRIHVNSILHFLKIDDRDGSIHAADMIELYGRLDELLDIGSHVFRSNNFLHETHLVKIADAACAPALNRQQIELACRMINKNVYTISDEAAAGLLEKLNRIQSHNSRLQSLKNRLQAFPSKKIPQVVSIIWHGNDFRMTTIDNLIRLRELNPDCKLRVYADSKEVVESALSEWIAQQVKKHGGFDEHYEKVQQLKSDSGKFEIRSHSSILNEPAIKKNYPRLIAYIERFGTKTRTSPNYALISDIERYAVLLDGGWYIDWNVAPQAKIPSAARAEAGIAMSLDLAGENDLTSNNYIIGTHPQSEVIKKILQKIHSEFDSRGEQVDPRLRAFHKYKPINFDPRIGGVPPGEEAQWEPATMQLSRFSYRGPHLDAPQDFLNISRGLGTMIHTGPILIGSVFDAHSKEKLLNSYTEGTMDYMETFKDIQTKVGAFAGVFRKEAVKSPASWARGVHHPDATAGETAFPLLKDEEAEGIARIFANKLLENARPTNRMSLKKLDQEEVESLAVKILKQEDFTKHDLGLMKYHIAKGNMNLATQVSTAPATEDSEFTTLGQAIDNLLARHPEHHIKKFMPWLDALNRSREKLARR